MEAQLHQQQARLAGGLYMLIAIIGGFCIGYIPSVLFGSPDALELTNNILKNLGLFKIAILGDLMVILIELFLSVILYKLFRSIHDTISRVALYARLGMVMIMGANLLNYLIPFYLIISDTSALPGQQKEALTQLFIEGHQFGVFVWGFFFGIHLLLLGYLVFRSRYVPRILGVLMMIGSLGYTVESMFKLTFTSHPIENVVINVLLGFAIVGEVSFAIRMLIKGVRKSD